MSANAKTIIASLVAVVITALQSWSVITTGGVHLLTVLPVATAIVAAVLTHVVPNVPELPYAKAVVSGALYVLTALSTFVGQHPSGVTAGTLLTVAAGAFLVWFVPNLPPLVAYTPAPSATTRRRWKPAPGPTVVGAPPVLDLSATQPIPVVPAAPPVQPAA